MASLTIVQAIDLWKTAIAGVKAGRHIENKVDAAYDGIWRAIIAGIEAVMVALMLGRTQPTSPKIYIQSVVPVARRVIADYAAALQKLRPNDAVLNEFAPGIRAELMTLIAGLKQFTDEGKQNRHGKGYCQARLTLLRNLRITAPMDGISSGARADMNLLQETWRDFEKAGRESAATAYVLHVNSVYDAARRMDVLALQPRQAGQGSLFAAKEEILGTLEMRLGSSGIMRREGQVIYAVHEEQLCRVFSELSRVIRTGEAHPLPAAGLPAVSITGIAYFTAFEGKDGALFRVLATYTTPGTGTDEHTTTCREFIETLHQLTAGKLAQQSSVIHIPFGQRAGQDAHKH